MVTKNKRTARTFFGLLLCMLAIVAGCDAPTKEPSARPAESDVLAALVNEGVLPNLARVADTAGRLEDRVGDLCENPDAETLRQARAAWREAYLAWRRAGPFLFGPAGDMERRIGKWPVNGVVLDAAADSADLRHMLDDADVRGYAAAEHMLFAPADASAATTPGRCAHLRSVAEEIARLAAEAKRQWEDGYAVEFMSAGNGEPFLLPADALSQAFAELLNVTERILRNRIGIPSGFFRAEASPGSLEAWRSKGTRDGFLASVEGIRQAVSGGGDSSLAMLIATKDGLVEAKNPALAAEMVRQMDEIERTIARLGGGDLMLEVELRENPSKLKRLYKRFQKLQEQLVEASLVLELDAHQGLRKLASDASADRTN